MKKRILFVALIVLATVVQGQPASAPEGVSVFRGTWVREILNSQGEWVPVEELIFQPDMIYVSIDRQDGDFFRDAWDVHGNELILSSPDGQSIYSWIKNEDGSIGLEALAEEGPDESQSSEAPPILSRLVSL